MKSSLREPKKLLIINIFGIGDVLFTTPLIRNLKIAFPNLEIGYVGNRRTAPILESNPLIHKVFVYERDEFNQIYRQSKILFLKKIFEFVKILRKEHYDTVLDVSLTSFMNFLTCVCGIPRRIGFNYKNRSPFLTHQVPFSGYEGRHVVEYYLDLLDALGVRGEKKDLELTVSKDDNQWAEVFFKENQIKANAPVIALVPGGGASWGKDAIFKRWEAQKYAKLADKIIEKFDADIILLGDQQEHTICDQVSDLMLGKPHLACGKTTIGQFAALIKRCSLAIVNDGGPLHIAVASGVKTVSIFGPVDEAVYGPYPLGKHGVVKKDLACRPCYRRFRRAECSHISCLHQITVEDVFVKVKEVL